MSLSPNKALKEGETHQTNVPSYLAAVMGMRKWNRGKPLSTRSPAQAEGLADEGVGRSGRAWKAVSVQ